MESISHEGWTIQTDSEKRCFGAVITDPCGNIYQQTRVCWENHHAARRSAQKFIQWYIKLGEETERRILQCAV